MKWLGAAFAGWAVGTITFFVVWSVLAEKFAKLPADREMPSWPARWAMSVAFVVIALSWAGAFKGLVPIGAFESFYD